MAALHLLSANAHGAPEALALDGSVHYGRIVELFAALNDLDWFALLGRMRRLLTMMRFGGRLHWISELK